LSLIKIINNKYGELGEMRKILLKNVNDDIIIGKGGKFSFFDNDI
jgi:hypothetical protein